VVGRANEEGRGSDFSGYGFVFVEVEDGLDEESADFEYIFLLEFSGDDVFEVEVEMFEDAVEAGLVLDDFFDA
jgi:hypothetical protein